MLKVIATDVLKPGSPEEATLKQFGASLTYCDCKTEAEVIECAKNADAIINVYAPITANVINCLKQCRVIVRRGIGYDTIDIKAATANGIPVANLPDYCVDEVADHTMALLLSVARRIVMGTNQTRSGGWDFKAFGAITGLKSSNLGLIGFGKIPRAVAERAKGFGIKVKAFDPFVSAEAAAEYGVALVGIEDLLCSSDFVSVHAPLNDKTRSMVSKREFAMMKPTAAIINTARGPVIDEEALIEALKTGKIGFAALDVMTKEPPAADNPLRKMENVILTPHLAWYSEDSARLAGEKAAQEIVRVFKGYFPKALVNPDVVNTSSNLKLGE